MPYEKLKICLNYTAQSMSEGFNATKTKTAILFHTLININSFVGRFGLLEIEEIQMNFSLQERRHGWNTWQSLLQKPQE
ncbi:unnamed protein product [Onchocerca flexuosa]|uniref:Uncharacterized protein n=1 Tax=Onchocerca flexuosa TaxID=387005 RepID=A0A183I126_9BILA|nr:unnamed protein product [Onchocerca flexuosa]